MAFRRKAFLVLYAASGAAALVYEITWTRLLTLLLGHTVAAASTVLAALMGGMALGSWVGGRFERFVSAGPAEGRGAIRLRTYAALELLVAFCACILPSLLATLVPVLKWA